MTDVKLEISLYVQKLELSNRIFTVDEGYYDHYVRLVGVSEIGKEPKVSVHLLIPPEDAHGLSFGSEIKLTAEWVKA